MTSQDEGAYMPLSAKTNRISVWQQTAGAIMRLLM